MSDFLSSMSPAANADSPAFDADDAAIAAALADADLPPLLAALAYLNADTTLLREELPLDQNMMSEAQGGWNPEQIEFARNLCRDALHAYRTNGQQPAPNTTELRAIVEFITGQPISDAEHQLLLEELDITGADTRAPDWQLADITTATDLHNVVIIGAGMSGLAAAHRLHQAGVPFTILEKNADVGGTWFENIYPGCRVDVPNHTYCYSFAPKADWSQFHSAQPELLEYFRNCADTFDLRQHIRFDTEVEALTFDESTARWHLRVHTAAGPEQIDAAVVVSAVGQLNRPSMPDIAGGESFAGRSFHSARWPADLDLAGKRVGVIGTGASATQFIPHVAEAAAHTTVFQRTPAWMVPRPEYRQNLPDGLLWLFRKIPGYARWFRLRLFWRSHEGSLPRLVIDPDWTEPLERSVSASNDEMRVLLTMYLEMQFGDRPDLLATAIPQYPVGAKRIIVDDGTWTNTLKRDDVTLCTDPLTEITPTGAIAGAQIHHFDILIYGTGFEAADFLLPMSVTGRDEADLHETWDGDARAYLGLTIPKFPNLLLMYGPNTNIVINGSIIYFSECEAHYIAEFVRTLAEHDIAALDCRADVHDRYVAWVDERNSQMAWGASAVNSWYKSASGGIAQNWPFSLLKYWEQTRVVELDDYDVLPAS